METGICDKFLYRTFESRALCPAIAGNLAGPIFRRLFFAPSFNDVFELGNDILFLAHHFEVIELLQIQPDIIA